MPSSTCWRLWPGALLAGVFRVAPKACWLMTAAHLARVFAQRCYDCRISSPLLAWPWLPELFAILAIALLCLAVRRLLRLQFFWGDVRALAGLGMLVVLALGLLGQQRWMLFSGSLVMLLMTLSTCRDILFGARPIMAGAWLVPLSLPFMALTAAWPGVACARWASPSPRCRHWPSACGCC